MVRHFALAYVRTAHHKPDREDMLSARIHGNETRILDEE